MTNKINRSQVEANMTKKLALGVRDDDLVPDCLDALFNSISEALSKGKAVQIRGFGAFRTVVRDRKTTCPRTGRKIGVQSENMIIFTPYSQMVKIHD